MDLHLYIHSSTGPPIKHKAQLNYTEFTAIVFITWKHSAGQAVQMLLHPYISHGSLILRGTAQLTFGHWCWKSCEMILKMWKTRPDSTGMVQWWGTDGYRDRNNPSTLCSLEWLSLCSGRRSDCSWAPVVTKSARARTHPCVFCSSAMSERDLSLHQQLLQSPCSLTGITFQDHFCPSLRTSSSPWSCSSWGHPAQGETGPVEGSCCSVGLVYLQSSRGDPAECAERLGSSSTAHMALNSGR